MSDRIDTPRASRRRFTPQFDVEAAGRFDMILVTVNVDLDWDAVACPCGAVVTCEGCDEVEACPVCRAARDEQEAS